ncbi:MAG: hypothetical protein ABIW47_05140 [Ginsengibacter sp.]|jgi:hypothetical protein
MTIDNIHLSNFLCHKLFKNSLIEHAEAEKIPEIPKKTKIQHLGLNNQHILFVVDNADHKYLGDAEMDMLTNLLTACKLSVADIALVNFAHYPGITYESLISELKSQKILTFGITMKDLNLPFNVPDFQIQKFQNQTYLFNPSMEKILNDVHLKKNLWICLKNLFSI